MSTKKERLDAICGIIQTKVISNQEELLKELEDSGFSVTQATLSRDIKQLKVAKVHDGTGDYVYRLPEESISKQAQPEGKKKPNIEFSGNLADREDRPGNHSVCDLEVVFLCDLVVGAVDAPAEISGDKLALLGV